MTETSNPSAGRFELLVTDARRQFDENGKVQRLSFWAFKVMCRSYLPAYQNPPLYPAAGAKMQNFVESGAGYVDYCSWHRYSDFEWLVDHLYWEFPGVLLPPLPPKENDANKDKVQDLVSNKEQENAKLVPFVQDRIRGLNLFLNVVMAVPELHESEHLKAFLAADEPNWFSHKDAVKARRHGTGVSAITGKLGSMFGRMSEKKITVYDPSTAFGAISVQQADLAAKLKNCLYRLRDVESFAHNNTAKLSDFDQQVAKNSCKTLAYPLVATGHYVSAKEHRRGQVVHLDDLGYAYVRWAPEAEGGSEKLDRVAVSELNYPDSGVVDPVIFATMEAVTQLESFFAYVAHRSESRDLEKLIDLVLFWRDFADEVPEAIKNLAEVEQRRQRLAGEACSTKDATKRQAKEQEVQQLEKDFRAGESRFQQLYGFVFRPMQKKALFEINVLVGRVCYNLLNDEDWPNRLHRADVSLQPNPAVPDDVVQMMEALANDPPPQFAREPSQPRLRSDPVPAAVSPQPQGQAASWGAPELSPVNKPSAAEESPPPLED